MRELQRLLTIGTFDLPHIGHAAFLRKCERFADEVIVGVNTDAFVSSFKPEPPVFNQKERSDLIRILGYSVYINDGPGIALIEQVNPSIIAVGSDWAKRDYYAQIATPVEYFEENEITLVYIPYTKGISSTALKARLRNA